MEDIHQEISRPEAQVAAQTAPCCLIEGQAVRVAYDRVLSGFVYPFAITQVAPGSINSRTTRLWTRSAAQGSTNTAHKRAHGCEDNEPERFNKTSILQSRERLVVGDAP